MAGRIKEGTKEYTFKCSQYPALKFEPAKGIFERFSNGTYKTKSAEVAEYLRNYKGIKITEIKAEIETETEE